MTGEGRLVKPPFGRIHPDPLAEPAGLGFSGVAAPCEPGLFADRLSAPRMMRIYNIPHFAIVNSPDLLAQLLHFDGPDRGRVGTRVGPSDSSRTCAAVGAAQDGRSQSRSDAGSVVAARTGPPRA